MSSKLVQALCAPGAAKDPAIGSIAQALVACVPSSAFSSEVDLLLSSLNDRPASIMVVVPQDGLDVRIGLVSFGQTIFSFGQHLLQTDVLGQELIEIVDQRVAICLCRLLCSLQGVHLFGLITSCNILNNFITSFIILNIL